ncbi:MAG: cyclase family protein [Myxococcota bacterium]
MDERRSTRPSNWGRWGPDDERGAANLVTPAVVARAATRVRRGHTYELGLDIRRDAPLGGPRSPMQHFMAVDGGDFAALGRPGWGTADDYVVMATGGTTHVDGLCHMWYDGHLYNGFPYTEVRSSGASRCGIEHLGGIVTTGHLFDFVGRPTDEPDVIGAADVRAYAAEYGIQVERGDAVLFRTGWVEAALRREDRSRSFPVVSPDVAGWLAERDVSLVGADNVAVEATPRPDQGSMPFHDVVLRDLGVYILELLHLAAPAADGVRSGMFVIAPLRIHRGVNSPLNPLLVV